MATPGPPRFNCLQTKNVFPFLNSCKKHKRIWRQRPYGAQLWASLCQELDFFKKQSLFFFALLCLKKKYRKRQYKRQEITAELNLYQRGGRWPWQKCNLKNTEKISNIYLNKKTSDLTFLFWLSSLFFTTFWMPMCLRSQAACGNEGTEQYLIRCPF